MNAKATEKEFERSFVLKVYTVCWKMGWTLDYVLNMNLEQFNQIYDIIDEIAREERKQAETGKLIGSLGAGKTLR